MKEILIKFRLPIIIVAVIGVFIIGAVIVNKVRQPVANKEEKTVSKNYFQTSDYPVQTKENEDGSLTILLNGKKTKDLSWKMENESPELVKVKDGEKEKDGKLSVTVSPLASGYGELTFLRDGKIGEKAYTAAQITVKLLVAENKEGKLYISMSDIYEDAANTGAADSETPYLIEQNRILLPNGGDWELTVEGEESLFQILTGANDEGIAYIDVYSEQVIPFLRAQLLSKDEIEKLTKEEQKAVEAAEAARLVLTSKKLKYTQKYRYQIDDSQNPYLKAVEE